MENTVELAIRNFLFFFFFFSFEITPLWITRIKRRRRGLDLYFINNKDAMNERVTRATLCNLGVVDTDILSPTRSYLS